MDREAAARQVFAGVAWVYAGFAACLVALGWLLAQPLDVLVAAGLALVFLVTGWLQFSLSHALHEWVHRNYGAPHREWLGAVLTVYPVGMTRAYRDVHLDHHRFFGDPERDPDLPAYRDFPATRRGFLLRLARSASGFDALVQVLTQRASTPRRPSGPGEPLRLVLVQAGVYAVFAATTTWWSYFLFWLAPAATVLKFCSTMRAFCEHGAPGDRLVYRNILGTWAQTKLLGPFNFHYHADHHRRPQEPYRRLPQVHAELEPVEAWAGVPVEDFAGGHLALLAAWYRGLPW